MSDKPGFDEALGNVMGLSYPPRVLSVPVSRAIGHRLAKTVVVRGNQPSRPVSLIDGIAVHARDVMLREAAGSAPDSGQVDEAQIEESYKEFADEPLGDAGSGDILTGGLVNVGVDTDRKRDQDNEAITYDDILTEDEGDTQDYDESEDAPVGNVPLIEAAQSKVDMELRPFPHSNRRDDALRPGQGVPVPAGGEVPRGADYIYPLDLVAEEASENPEVRQVKVAVDSGDGSEESVSIMEVERSWDLPQRFQRGQVELAQIARTSSRNMINIGAWARNREAIIPEKVVLRSTEITLLQTIGIEEVDVFRKPVVGVASFGQPFPTAGRAGSRDEVRGICPLTSVAVELSRAAQIATLSLGFAPLRYHELVGAVERWMDQVDLLVLVGGSHHGVRCLGHDLLATRGQVALSGTRLAPCQAISVGRVRNKPVFVLPGSLSTVLSSMVLFVRPLAHKYLTPRNFSDSVEIELERGSRLQFEQDTVMPLRYSLNRQSGTYSTRFAGRMGDEWMEYFSGQALVVFEGGRSYSDGERVRGYTY